MVCGESYLVWNMAMSACALPLGGKLAGLPLPGRREWAVSAVMSGALALSPLAVMGLPGGVALCFHQHGFPACMRCGMMTLVASCLTGGAMTALLSAGLTPEAAATVAMGLSLAAYLFVTLLPQALCEVRQVELKANGNAILLPAMLDSGNLLRDPITGRGVLVIPCGAARALFPHMEEAETLTSLPQGFRLLSVRTAAGSALLPIFKPDECRIYVNGRACKADTLVAVAGREYRGVQALVPMSALPGSALSS